DLGAASVKRLAAEIAVAEAKEVPEDNRAGALLREHLHARGRWVESKLERLEIEAPVVCDDELAIEHAALGEHGPKRRFELREIAIERLLIPALDRQLVAIAEHEGPKPVPFGLVHPPLALRKRADPLGEHRQQGRRNGQHAPGAPVSGSPAGGAPA